MDVRVSAGTRFYKVIPKVDSEANPLLSPFSAALLIEGPVDENGVGGVVISDTTFPRVTLAVGSVTYQTLPGDLVTAGCYQYALTSQTTSGDAPTVEARGLLFVDAI